MRLADTGFAKINLALHVRRRRADGLHDIETIFAFARDGDALSAEPADALSLHVDGPFAEGLSSDENNLAMRAARALAAAHGLGARARLQLTKRLPVASGIGGGSADAAATLRLLARMWDVEIPDGLPAALGADVPACIGSITARAEGLGHPVRAVSDQALSGTPLLLVNPGVALATGAVFAQWDGIDRGPLREGDPLAASLAGRNDLEAAARGLRPEIDAVLAALAASAGVVLSRMSGSGATCFALFVDGVACAAAAAAIRAAHPQWWCLETALR